jgi:hypothetical protein
MVRTSLKGVKPRNLSFISPSKKYLKTIDNCSVLEISFVSSANIEKYTHSFTSEDIF